MSADAPLSDARLFAVESHASHPTRRLRKAEVLAVCRETRRLQALVKAHGGHLSEVISGAVGAERERAIALIRRYLLCDSQRAVSWHEVQDCIAAIQRDAAG